MTMPLPGQSPYGPYPRPPQQPFPYPPQPRYATPASPALCQFCAGKHALPSTPACPRLATFELDGDGRVKSGTYWPGTKWARGRVLLAEDEAEEGDGDDQPG